MEKGAREHPEGTHGPVEASTRPKPKAPIAQKPLRRQWSGAFICPSCHHQYRHRCSLRRHQVQCSLREPIPKHLVREVHLHLGPDPAHDLRRLHPVTKRKGRAPFLLHACKSCERTFPDARKKRDHQRRCKPSKLLVFEYRDITPTFDFATIPSHAKLHYYHSKRHSDKFYVMYSQDK